MKFERIFARKYFLLFALANLSGVLTLSRAQAQTFSVVYSFTGGNDGGDSVAGLQMVSGQFYGTTTSGGAHGNGVVFKIDTSGQESAIYSFAG